MAVQSKHPATDTTAFLQAIAGFAVAALVVLGVGGTLYNLLTPGGWLAGLFARSVASGVSALLVVLLIGVSFWLLRDWISDRLRRQYPELFVYAFAATGLVYAFQIYSEGSL